MQVILESDQTSMKILDYLNKRVADPRTSAFPLISSVVLVPPNADYDVLQLIEAVGGTNAVIHLPSSSSDILQNILDVLYRRKLVETTFRDLKIIDQRERYPYLSIFAKQGQNNQNHILYIDGDCGEESMDNKIVEGISGHYKYNDSNSNDNDNDNNAYAIPTDLSYIVLKNNEDWTTCSSMLPRALKKLRKKERQKHPVTFTTVDNTQTEKLFYETTERGKIDKSILKKLTSAAAMSVRGVKSDVHDNEVVPYAISVLSRDSTDNRTVESSPSDSGTDNSDDDYNEDEHDNNYNNNNGHNDTYGQNNNNFKSVTTS